MKNIFSVFLISILLAACGGGSSSDGDSGDTNPSNEPGNTYEPPVTETPNDAAEDTDDTPDNDLPPVQTPADNGPGGDVPPVDDLPTGETPSDGNPGDGGPSGDDPTGSLPPAGDQPDETPDNDAPRVSLLNGRQQYVVQCQLCHGEQGNGIVKIDASKFNETSLASYIALEMPVNEESNCVDNCATNITAYIFNSYSIDDSGAEPDDDGKVVAQCNRTTYGPRQIKLLTRTEYQNSLEDLVGIDFDATASLPFDTLVHGYTNNAGTVITENHADAYLAIAERAAEFAARQNFAQAIDCGQGSAALPYEQCTQKFLDEFGTRAFRRPLTSEERSTYAQLFDNRLTGGDIAEALKLGITAMLTAPQFLYRSEVGDAVEDVLNGEAGDIIPDGEARTLAGPDFRQKTTGQREGDGGWNIYSEGYIEDAFNFTEQALIRIAMKGDIAQNRWPIMELLIDNQVRATTAVETGEYATFQFPVNGFNGTHNVQIRFTNDFFQNGEDRNLYVQQMTVSGAKAAPAQPAGDTTDLAQLDSDAYVLSAYELASYLSYTFTGSTPDAELLAAAEKGELQTAQQLREQIQRLLQSERAIEHMGNFAAQWLGTDAILNEQKNRDLFPGFTQSVREAMAEEVRAMFTHVFYDENESFASLFNADYVFANNVLANFYGLGGINSALMVKVENVLDRGGLLTTGAFLATYADADESSPIKRAVTIRERLMCQDIAPPPNNIGEFRTEEEERLKQELAGQVISNRDFVTAITANELWATCHEKIINPLGFGLEDFDAAGRHRSQDFNGLSIDSSGVLFGLSALDDGASATFDGAKDLSNLLADTSSTQSCFAANAFRFAMDIGHDQIDKANPAAGRLQPDEVADYGCSVSTLTSTLEGGNQTPKALFQALGTLEVVRYRKQRDR